MAEQQPVDKQGMREDLKNDPDVLHQPDADRSERDLKTLDYDQTVAFLKGDLAVKPDFNLADDVLKQVREKLPKIDDHDVDSIIKDKYQQILLARYNESQAQNVTVAPQTDQKD